MKFFRALAVAYAIAIGLTIVWAWWVDVRLLHSAGEHLLPDFVLFFASLPSSLSLNYLYDTWPTAFSQPLAQLGWVTLCGVAQAAALVLLVAGRRRSDAT